MTPQFPVNIAISSSRNSRCTRRHVSRSSPASFSAARTSSSSSGRQSPTVSRIVSLSACTPASVSLTAQQRAVRMTQRVGAITQAFVFSAQDFGAAHVR